MEQEEEKEEEEEKYKLRFWTVAMRAKAKFSDGVFRRV